MKYPLNNMEYSKNGCAETIVQDTLDKSVVIGSQVCVVEKEHCEKDTTEEDLKVEGDKGSKAQKTKLKMVMLMWKKKRRQKVKVK